jgi:chitooligosaccharide deacetylase
VYWSVDPEDWIDPQPPADTIVARVLNAVRPGAIVLLHDGCSPNRDGHSRAETVEAARRLIPALRAAGLEPTTVSRLLESVVP